MQQREFELRTRMRSVRLALSCCCVDWSKKRPNRCLPNDSWEEKKKCAYSKHGDFIYKLKLFCVFYHALLLSVNFASFCSVIMETYSFNQFSFCFISDQIRLLVICFKIWDGRKNISGNFLTITTCSKI